MTATLERLPPNATARVVAALYPYTRILSARRLLGGTWARVRLVTLEEAGERRQVVLKFSNGNQEVSEGNPREFRVLELLRHTPVPAPEPLLLDAEGKIAGASVLAMSYLGRPLVRPRNLNSWIDDLARALSIIHSVTPDRYDLSLLEAPGPAEGWRQAKDLPAAIDSDPLAQSVLAARRASLDKVAPRPLSLSHNDYWPGNTVWRNGRLTGVIDWTDARVADPRVDVVQGRADLAMMHGLEAADAFLTAYERYAGCRLPDLWLFDAWWGLLALEHHADWWLPIYHDLGLGQLTAAILESRVRAFLEAALVNAR